MTVRLAAIFEEHVKKIIHNWKMAKRRRSGRRKLNSTTSSDSTISSSSSSSEEEEEEKLTVQPKEVESEDSEDMPLEVLRSRTNTESDSTSRSLDKVVPRPKKPRSDSGDDYSPSLEYSSSRRRRKVTSSEDEEELTITSEDSEKSEGYKRKSNLRSRPVRRKVLLYESSDTENSSGMNTRRKRRRKAESDSDSGSKSSRQTNDRSFISSVSSRGRVRKLTERAKALFKKR